MIKTSNKMERTCAIEKLFNAVKTSHEQSAKDVLEQAKQERAILKNVKHINDIGKRSLKLINEMIEHVSKGQLTNAKAKYKEAERGFSGQLKSYLLQKKREMREIKEVEALSKDVPEENSAQKQGKQGKNQQSRDTTRQGQHPPENTKQRSSRQETLEEPDHLSDLRRNGQTKNENPPKIDNNDHMRSIKGNDDFHKIERSKRASLKMRQNNPDIADLSDTNRPTKIAERFSEMYDNEWTEAFEEICKKNWNEKETIECLLTVVKEAYKFCSHAAERQVKEITKVVDRILEFGPDDYNKELTSQSNTQNEEGSKLIVQYRKEKAGLALPKLKKDFLENKTPQWKRKSKLPAHLASFDLYAAKAVELTWWMCVQDPPIVLCPTNGGDEDSFDKSLYRAYTKSGSEPDFFVWPALKLHVEGGVLMKGVVQFK